MSHPIMSGSLQIPGLLCRSNYISPLFSPCIVSNSLNLEMISTPFMTTKQQLKDIFMKGILSTMICLCCWQARNAYRCLRSSWAGVLKYMIDFADLIIFLHYFPCKQIWFWSNSRNNVILPDLVSYFVSYTTCVYITL